MMKKYLSIFTFLVFTLTTSLVFSQSASDALSYTWRSPASGVQSMGLAGAGIASVNNWSALYTNPAGLGLVNHTQLEGSLNFLRGTDDALYTAPGISNSFSTIASNTTFSNLGYVYKAPTVQGAFVLAAGYNQSNDFSRLLRFDGLNNGNSISDFLMPVVGEFEIYNQTAGEDSILNTNDDEFDISFTRSLSLIAFEAFGIDFDRDLYYAGADVPFLPAVTAGTVLQEGEVYEEGSSGDFSMGAAIEAAPGVLVGASVNFVFGDYSYTRIFEESDINNDNDGQNGTTDFRSLKLTDNISSDIFGFSLRAGISAKLLAGLRLGLTVETPTYHNIHEIYSTVLETEFDNGDWGNYGGLQDDSGTGEFDYQVITPWKFGAGVSWSLNNLLTLSGDAEYVDWTQLELSADIDQAYFQDVNRQIRNNYKPALNYRAGAEVKFQQLALRGGYAMQFDPRDDETISRDRVYYSAGVGYTLSDQFTVNVSWMQSKFDDQYRPYSLNEIPQETDPVVNESVGRSQVLVGVVIGL